MTLTTLMTLITQANLEFHPWPWPWIMYIFHQTPGIVISSQPDLIQIVTLPVVGYAKICSKHMSRGLFYCKFQLEQYIISIQIWIVCEIIAGWLDPWMLSSWILHIITSISRCTSWYWQNNTKRHDPHPLAKESYIIFTQPLISPVINDYEDSYGLFLHLKSHSCNLAVQDHMNLDGSCNTWPGH